MSDCEALSRHLARFWLRRYQAALREFDQLEAPLPVRWDNWREANAQEKRKQDFLWRWKRNLERARARTRAILVYQYA